MHLPRNCFERPLRCDRPRPRASARGCPANPDPNPETMKMSAMIALQKAVVEALTAERGLDRPDRRQQRSSMTFRPASGRPTWCFDFGFLRRLEHGDGSRRRTPVRTRCLGPRARPQNGCPHRGGGNRRARTDRLDRRALAAGQSAPCFDGFRSRYPDRISPRADDVPCRHRTGLKPALN